MGFPGGTSGKEPAYQSWRCKVMCIRSLGWEGISCLENPSDRSLAGYSPWGCKESDMTEVT